MLASAEHRLDVEDELPSSRAVQGAWGQMHVQQLVADVLHVDLRGVLLVDALIPHDAILRDHVHGILTITVHCVLVLEDEEIYHILTHSVLEGPLLFLELLVVDEAPLAVWALVNEAVHEDLVGLGHESGQNQVLAHGELLDGVQVRLALDFDFVHHGSLVFRHRRVKHTSASQRELRVPHVVVQARELPDLED